MPYFKHNLPLKVKIFGKPNSPEAYAIRDFLKRNVVKYEWTEVADSHHLAKLLGISLPDDAQLPVVELADGKHLFAPSISKIVHRLG